VDPCTAASLILCGGTTNSSISAPNPPVFHPTIAQIGDLPVPIPKQDPGTDAGQLLGNNTCRYTGTYYTYGDFGGNGLYAADYNQGAYSSSQATASGIWPMTQSAYAYAEVGVLVYLTPDWPQPSNVTVDYPWHTRGQFSVDAGANIFGGTGYGHAQHYLGLWLRQGSIGAYQEVVDESLTTNLGPRDRSVSRDGFNSLNVSSPGNQTYTGYIRSDTTVQASSTYAANANAFADFFQAGHAWTDYQDWHFNLPPGWVIVSC
jgi:hypothetical protein